MRILLKCLKQIVKTIRLRLPI